MVKNIEVIRQNMLSHARVMVIGVSSDLNEIIQSVTLYEACSLAWEHAKEEHTNTVICTDTVYTI